MLLFKLMDHLPQHGKVNSGKFQNLNELMMVVLSQKKTEQCQSLPLLTADS